MGKRIERYEGRSAEDLNEKNCCAFCGGLLGRNNGNYYEKIYTNTAGLFFDRQSCRTKHNKDTQKSSPYYDAAGARGILL